MSTNSGEAPSKPESLKVAKTHIGNCQSEISSTTSIGGTTASSSAKPCPVMDGTSFDVVGKCIGTCRCQMVSKTPLQLDSPSKGDSPTKGETKVVNGGSPYKGQYASKISASPNQICCSPLFFFSPRDSIPANNAKFLLLHCNGPGPPRQSPWVPALPI